MKCLFLLLLFLITLGCMGQEKKVKQLVGGPCEGCEAIYEYGDQVLNNLDTLPNYLENEPKIKLTGTVFNKDGSPAENIVIYLYHTNRSGIYETNGTETGWARRHGLFRGWVQTDVNGRYTVYTFRPASYPNRDEPEHIHMTIKEPDMNAYYIDNIVFVDDPLLTPEKIKLLPGRAGSGIVTPRRLGELWEVRRDIILGKNIPNYLR